MKHKFSAQSSCIYPSLYVCHNIFFFNLAVHKRFGLLRGIHSYETANQCEDLLLMHTVQRSLVSLQRSLCSSCCITRSIPTSAPNILRNCGLCDMSHIVATILWGSGESQSAVVIMMPVLGTAKGSMNRRACGGWSLMPIVGVVIAVFPAVPASCALEFC